MAPGNDRRQDMFHVRPLSLLNGGPAHLHLMDAVNGLRHAADNGAGKKENAYETRHNSLPPQTSGTAQRAVSLFEYTNNINSFANPSRDFLRCRPARRFRTKKLRFFLTKKNAGNKNEGSARKTDS